MKRLILAMSVFVLLVACGHQKVDIAPIVEIGECDKEIQTFSDSSFFSDIACIQIDGRKDVYVLDRKRSQIIRLNKDLNLISTIGQKGRGPQELGVGANFVVHNDTVFVGDVYKRSLLCFSPSGEWCGMIEMPEAFPYFKRFAVGDDGSVCFSWPKENGESLVDYNRWSGGRVKFGEFTDFGTPNKNDMQNARSTFIWNEQYVVVPWSLPVVESYARKTHQLVGKLDLSDVSPVGEIYRNLAADRELLEAPMGFYVLMVDAYLAGDKLYVLLNPREGEASEFKVGSVILEIGVSDDGMSVERRLSLPGEILTRIGVADDYIYGFVPKSSSIKRYPLPA